jgi:CubicO group peptidase (beta-lactamase class C family)
VFDLASLTKPMATLSCFMALWAKGKLGPSTPVAKYFPTSAAAEAGLTIADLLYHRSGLPPFVPYFSRAMPAVPELFAASCPADVRRQVRDEVVQAALRSRLRDEPGAAAVYSDVGFIVLGELLAAVAQQPLDALFARLVAAPLALQARFLRLSSTDARPADVAPTGTQRPREPAPGQEGMWAPFPAHPSRPGEVDDDNAWVMDGVAGHAGLFGTAQDVARFGQGVLDELHGAAKLAPLALWERAVAVDFGTPGSSRALGFDTPGRKAGETSSAGARLGDQAPGAVGHLGFTGTSVWIDLARQLVVALVTNRTFLGRANVGIRAFRPRFHDAVFTALEL